jgi:hypothetical protein
MHDGRPCNAPRGENKKMGKTTTSRRVKKKMTSNSMPRGRGYA